MRRHIALPAMDRGHFFCFPDSIGHYHSLPQHHVDRQAGELPDFNLHLVTSGQGYVEVDGDVYTLNPGDAFLYFPGQAQRYYSSEEKPWEVYWIHFYGARVGEYLTDRGFARSSRWTLRQWQQLQHLFEALLLAAKENSLMHAANISMLTYGLLAEMVVQAEPPIVRRGSDAIEQILALLPAMQEAAVQPFELHEWARRADMSVSYFCRTFRKATQRTPSEFITLCRLRQAKQMLIETREKTIGSIAEACGYESASYFIKRFREHEGITPSEYRSRLS